MGKIFIERRPDGSVQAVATTVVNGSHRRISVKVVKADDDDSLHKEQWRQAVMNLFEVKDTLQNGASEPKKEQ